MADPMNIQTFGRAKVNMNDVKSTEVVKDSKTGKQTFLINFKNGTKVQYPAQATKNLSAIRIVNDDTIAINRFYGLEFTGSETQNNNVLLEGSQNCKIDVSAPTHDTVTILDDKDTGKTYKSDNNTVIGKCDQVFDNYEKVDIGKFSVHHEGDRPQQLN